MFVYNAVPCLKVISGVCYSGGSFSHINPKKLDAFRYVFHDDFVISFSTYPEGLQDCFPMLITLPSIKIT